MTEPTSGAMADPVVRRVLGVVVLVFDLALVLGLGWLAGHGELPPAAMLLGLGLSGAMTSAGLQLATRPTRRINGWPFRHPGP
jgi:hypothetical protein